MPAAIPQAATVHIVDSWDAFDHVPRVCWIVALSRKPSSGGRGKFGRAVCCDHRRFPGFSHVQLFGTSIAARFRSKSCAMLGGLVD